MARSVLTLCLVMFCAEVSAQGFNTVNDRNHPHLNWVVAETEHFRIVYPDHLSGLEAEVAAIAEAAYDALSENLDVTFDPTIRLYFSDTDEINNGFAVPVGGGYAAMWVNLNDYAENWTGSHKWLRKVIAHELAHIFHFEATRTNLGLLNYAVGSPTPSFWTEGLAQYQTEEWDAQRGDRWLRLSIFDSRPEFDNQRSLINPRLRYASGNAQMRYFTEMYGDSTLAELLAHRDSLFGLETHDVGRAFRSTIDKSYGDFYEEWRKHMNVYYNTLASQMDRVDSLQTEAEELPGQYFFDVKFSPDQDRIAVLSLPTMQRPVRLLQIVTSDSLRAVVNAAEGNIRSDLAWSPDGNDIAFSRRVRGENSSLLQDIFLLDTRTLSERQVTRSRRAISPVFGPDGDEIAYIVNEQGTGNVVILDLETGRERYVTGYEGDVQVVNLVWNHHRNEFVYHRFDEDGNRYLVITDTDTGRGVVLDDGAEDNRMPLISPDGNRIAFTSLRDEVPNIFVTDLDADTTWRVTNLFTGAEAYDWLGSNDTLETEKLVIKATETKRWDEIFLIDADLNRGQISPSVNREYATWRTHRPENVIPARIESDETLIRNRYRYNSWRNLSHGLSLALPYYAGPVDYGIFAGTGWIEPLGKHTVAAAGIFSFGDPDRSYGLFSYVNNQLYPTLSLSAYRSLVPSQFYGPDFLVERVHGIDLSAVWPLDSFETSYRRSWLGSRLRYFYTEPHMFTEQFSPEIPDPQAGRQFDLRISWLLDKQRPYYQRLIHPLDGYGVHLSATGAERVLGAETSFLKTEASAYTIRPVIGLIRLYLSGRIQIQFGEVLPQEFIGFSRIDNIQLPLEVGPVDLQALQADRVRGYREFIAGRQVLFGSTELRMPFLPSLNTTILGFLQLGETSLGLFADAGFVREITVSEQETGDRQGRLGIGTEINNIVGIGPLRFVHSVGIARPYDALFETEYDLYYRLRARVPF